MKELVLAIIDALKNGQIDVERENVVLTPFLGHVPNSTRTPAFCVKDGPVSIRHLAGGVKEYTMMAYVIVWVQIPENEGASLVGDGTEKGVLDLTPVVCAVLDQNSLDIAGIQSADLVAERASEMSANVSVQRKVLEFKYVKETEGTCGS